MTAGAAPPDGVASTAATGLAYLDATGVDRSGTSSTAAHVDVKRLYLSFEHRFGDVWSVSATTDFNYAGATGTSAFFIKKLYSQARVSPAVVVRVGSANLPWIPFVEDLYGYRFVEPTLIDRLHFGTSADWGVHLLGERGVVDYQVSAVNGLGYRKPQRSGHVDFEGRVALRPAAGLTLAVGGYAGRPAGTGPAPAADARRIDALLAWNREGWRLGAEWYRADNWKNVATPFGDTADGWSLWGSHDFLRASLFARYDSVKPSKGIDPSLKDTYWNAGVAFPINKGVKVAVAYKDERLRNHTNVDVHTREIGAWAEARW